ncbi:phage tail tape measure protein [Nocardioides sp. LHD-245]|uniref:phage tail tape measure protein n=1 Tax=Nocardioides sp. LHD-245 TaxID=3051387 RepID=UPI0027E1B3D2|nr:phage tail tape measure protein [Nocardioides sp. LHD-245]
MAGPIRIAILANGSQARREFAQVEGSMTRFQSSAAKAAKLGAGALVLGVGAFAKSAVDAEKQFSTSMRLIQANTKSSAAEMDKLNRLALKLGADTSFSASEAADAMLELSKAGLDTRTIMGGGLAGTLQLAAAGGTDLATASTIASNALNTFNLAGEDMASVSAALAGGANASTASVESLGMALQQVGPGATNAGLSLQETVAALSAFDAAGVKGSDAGTSLKTMLARLIPSTKQAALEMQDLGLNFVDAQGNFKSLTNIAGQLNRALKDKSEAERTAALTTIFGSDATRAATVLMNEGASGIRKYIRATKDQNAAQELAKARMDGTEGALERLSGSIETAQLRLGQELAPAVVKGADLLDDKLVPAIEGAIGAGRDIANALAPAADEITEALGNLAGEGESVGKIFDDVFLPALETGAEVVGGLVNLVDEIPGPLKEIGLQAGIAALVLPRFTAGVTSATTAVGGHITSLRVLKLEMQDTAARARLLSTATSAMGGAMKTAAGIGGMVALTQGAQESNDALKSLYSVAGGALAGFAVGGPVGAVVGGVGGALAAVAGRSDEATDAVRASAEAARNAIGGWEDYAATLDQVTGSITRQTRVEAAQRLQKTEAFDLARSLGISTQDLVKASLGREKASARVQAALQAEMYTTSTYVDQLGNWHTTSSALNTDAAKLAGLLGIQSTEISKATGEVQDLSIASGALKKELKGVQDRGTIVTRVERKGFPETEEALRKILRGIELTPEQVKTTIKALGVTDAIRDVDRFADSVANQAPRKAKEGGKKTGKAITDGATEGLSTTALERKLKLGVKQTADGAKGPAAQGGVDVGNGLGFGLWGSMSAWVGPIRAKGYEMGKAGVDGAKAGAATQSPSRETIWVGRMLGEGMVGGMNASAPAVEVAGRKVSKAAIAGILSGLTDSSSVDAALDALTKQIEKSIKPGKGKKAQQREEKREKAVLKELKGQFAQLRANGAEYDRINGLLGERVEQEQTAYDQLRAAQQAYRDYGDAIRNTITATGDVTQLGRQEDGTVSGTALINEFEQKVIRAERFQDLMRQLADDQLSQAQVEQMLTAGPEAALATAEAIAAGGQASIDQMNRLQDRLVAAGGVLGDNMAARYKQAGIDAAQGLVNGLESQLAAVQAAAAAIAAALTNTVKIKLKVKSPSRVFRDIGDDVMRGLDIGIDDTVASRAGARTASSLVRGFGDPALEARAAWAAGVGGARPLVVQVEGRFTAEEASLLQQGREIVMKIDYARSNGVMAATF